MLLFLFRVTGHLFVILLFFFLYRLSKKWYAGRILVDVLCIGLIVIEAGFMIIEIYAFVADWADPPITESIKVSWLPLWFSFVLELFCVKYLIQGFYQYFFQKKTSDSALWQLFAMLRINAIIISVFMFAIMMFFDEISPLNPTSFFNTPFKQHGEILYRPGEIVGLAAYLFLIFIGLAVLFYIAELLTKRFVSRS